jgi:hypothetical protein
MCERWRTIIGLTVVVFMASVLPNKAAEPESNKPSIALKTLVAIGENGNCPTFVFVLNNTGKKEYNTTPICTNYNRIIIITPNKTEKEVYSWKKYDKMPITVKPGCEYTWKQGITSIDAFFKGKCFNQKGEYILEWRVEGVSSNRILLYKADDDKAVKEETKGNAVRHEESHRESCIKIEGVAAQGTVDADFPVKSTGNEGNHEVQEGDGRK